MHNTAKKIIIIGTVPYNEKSTSRAFDSYFHYYDSSNLAQIFSNAKTPVKGHCGRLYQITDARLLKRHFYRDIKVGFSFTRESLPDKWEDDALEVGNTEKRLYNLGSHKLPVVYLARKALWNRKYWCTEELNEWLDDFKPDCVFLSFSDDFFIQQIALYVSERFGIPIISSIGDDYYFNYHFSIDPFYHLYKLKYRKLVRSVFARPGSAIYIGDKIRDKYNSEFGLNGKTVYLTSSIECRPFKAINSERPKISYFGNIRLGRNESLCDIADVLGEISSDYSIDVYSNEREERYYNRLMNHPNVNYHGSVPYSVVRQETVKSDILLVVEGFSKKDVDTVRYSLSTKVADSLASGVSVFAYGSPEAGAIEYCASTKCICVCCDKKDLKNKINSLLFNEQLQISNYEKSKAVVRQNHLLERSCSTFESVVNTVCLK